MPRKRRVFSVSEELVRKSREVTLSAVQIFNNPLMYFKSEAFIVLMIISWTYLLHAYYKKQGVEYRYFEKKNERRIFDRTKNGAYKHWELEQCLNHEDCPIDKDTANNLRFLIGLRHEIEHQMTGNLDSYLSGRYQACVLNYSHYIKQLFGEKYGIDQHLSYSIQLVELSYNQLSKPSDEPDIPPRVRAYILEFDKSLSEDEYNNEKYAYRLLFTKKLVNRPGQADRVIEFLDPSSELAQKIGSEYWVKKEVERPKFRPTQICEMIQKEGFPKFTISQHTRLWQSQEAKKTGKGYGTEVAGQWYWYESWLEVVRQHCSENRALYT